MLLIKSHTTVNARRRQNCKTLSAITKMGNTVKKSQVTPDDEEEAKVRWMQ